MSVLVPLLLAIATGASSPIRTDTQSLERDASLVRFVESDGRVIERGERGERRVLIELRARPTLDRKAPGTFAEARRQREQLESDLATIDTRVQAQVPSRVTRRYETLFSGVAAVVSVKSLAEIRRLPDVTVHDDVEVHAQLTESVPMIGAPTIWSSYGVTGVGVKVAVIDTGIDYTHPDLGGCFGAGCRVVGGYDFVNNDADPMDDNGHGTHVAGIVAANGTLKGVAPGATLLAYKALNANGDGLESDVIAALERAVTDGARVANMSLGAPGDPNDVISQAVDNATAAGLLSVVAAGNSGPAYRTISSPGVARTALTVGAVDKTGVIAPFSSRGDVSDGVQNVMKPEIVAPGVAIRSTVPATGMYGDPSRYATLSGTSMAAPHVAGAAALLLEWNAAQSPADLKNRLTTSALPSLGDPFTEGAGRVDLVPAFGLSILSSVAHVPLGAATGSSGTVTLQKMFSLRNTSTSAKTLTLAASRPFPAGTTLGIAPASVTILAGESVNVAVTLQVDTAVTPEAPEPLAWSTSIAISGGGPTNNVPVYFFRASLLTLTFDEAPWQVTLLNPLRNVVRYFKDPGVSFSALVQSGNWDVLAHFRRAYGAPIPIVVREEQSVQNQRSLSIQRAEANLALTVQPVDQDQQPLNGSDGTTDMIIALRDPLSPDRIWFFTGSGSSTFDDFRLSSVSSRYLVGIIAGAPAPGGRYYIYSWSGAGLNQDVVLPDAGTPMRRLSQAAPSFPSATLLASTGYTVKMRETTLTIQAFNGNFHPAWSDGWTFYRQTTSVFGPPLIYFHQTSLTSPSDVINGPFLRYDGGDEIQADRLPYFNIFNPSRAPDAILGAAVERWEMDAPPNGLPLRFRNSTSSVHAIKESFDGPAWLTSTLGRIQTASGTAPQFTLSRAGVPVATLPLPQLFGSISSPAGPHELRSASAYKIGNVAGTSNVVASFNTSAGDPNPPYLSRFRIEQNGQPTVTPLRPSTSSSTLVRFRAADDEASLTSVALEWKQTGTAAWHPTPLTNVGAEYSAPFVQEGSVDLRLSASDASGNTFQQEWLPAVITTGSPAPAAPSQVLATREGATSIRVSWAPSSGPAGVKEYRIERLPGPQTATVSATTFLDTAGLVDGGVYAYRVIAVGNDDAVSTPSGYDVAALVTFQDEPLMPGVTPIRGAHVAELRSAIDSLRQAVSLPPSWVSGGTPSDLVTAADFAAMRDRMNDARTILGLAPAQFSMPSGVGILIRASHLQELRDALR